MTNEECIKVIKSECYISDLLDLDRTQMVNTALDMAIKALEEQPRWIPVKAHAITEEEAEIEGYPDDWVYLFDCEMPADNEEILITTESGYIAKDICYIDDGYSLDSGYDWLTDIKTWMPLPQPYKEGEE